MTRRKRCPAFLISALAALLAFSAVRVWGDSPAKEKTSGLPETAAASAPDKTDPSGAAPEGAEAAGADPDTDPTAATARERTTLNLHGQVAAGDGESRRNENVQLTLLDNNVLKELNQRLGTTATIVQEFRVEENYFGVEFGGDPKTALHIDAAGGPGFHGQIFWSHNNSLFSARSFFQAGDVQPARTNDYGFSLAVPLSAKTFLTVDGSQRKLRGQVNGNVLVPAADERTPTTTDPAEVAQVNRILGAFPNQLPNRTDINPRALNTNAPQSVDDHRANATLDYAVDDKDHLTLRYGLTLQDVEAFQLVGGQNPDTTTKNHQARITWSRVWSPATTTDFSGGYDRISSLLVPEETSLGPAYVFSRIIESVGPFDVPVDRAQNVFRYAARVRHIRGGHLLTAGGELLRRQINGFESLDSLGLFRFSQDFGLDVVGNLLAAQPSEYRQAIGSPHRGFRNWDVQLYLGDEWKVNSKLTLSLGLRYEPVTPATEVNNLSEISYDCDCNNVAPRFGFAFRASDRWGVFRGAYGLQYGEIFPATFMQTRFNPPGVLLISVTTPDLLDPLKNLTPADLDPNARSGLIRLDPELASPYSHQYNFSWELRPHKNWAVELAYVGSRSHKLLTAWYLNRARPVDGIAQTTQTVDSRRPDQHFFEIQHALNGSRGYFDAAKITLRIPRWARLTADASYWWSKAIDLGSDYTSTGASFDAFRNRSPSEFEAHGLLRGPSNFHQPHAMLWRVQYETGGAGAPNGWLRKIFGHWELSVVVLLKSGTPFTITSGSDGPGFGNVDGSGADRPHVIDPAVLGLTVDNPDTSQKLLPASAFAFIGPTDEAGNLGRNTFRKDSVWNINSGLSRRFTVATDRTLLFRAESLNFLNHPQFAEPGTNLSSRSFAAITNTLNDGRTFRFLLEFNF
jgi:hypothetical protein